MNVEAFKNLIEKYESISLIDIKTEWDEWDDCANSGDIMHGLTGFGSCYTCSLCKSVGTTEGGTEWKTSCNCQNCMYYLVNPDGKYPPCIDDIYYTIDNAETPEQLYDAIQKRIEFMKSIIEMYERN